MKVLFVCVGNACRSKMAEGFFNKYANGSVAQSAGTNPANEVSSVAVEVMKEEGVDIDGSKPRKLTVEMVENADKIITMGCLSHSSCPLFLIENREKVENWGVEDPRGKPVEKFREVRDIVKRKVEGILRAEAC